jgi:putative spermidine/putrescine transport system substrate-binding protein
MHKPCLSLLCLSILLLSACSVARSDTSLSAGVDHPAILPWEQVVELAKGSIVNLFMWGGDDNINRYIVGFVAEQIKAEYNITLRQTPLADTAEAVNKLLGEKTANKQMGGSIDLVWINGENFRTMRQGGLLYGPWAQQLPNTDLIPWDDPSIAKDFGYPVDGYEAPWGRAQFVLIYDSARVPKPPQSFAELLEWAKGHPGRFTYPAPPDFTGSAFVRHAFYKLGNGYENFAGSFSKQTYDKAAPIVWDYFNELKQYQWRGGATFPQSIDQLNQLFANGEVDLSMSYNPAFASGAIERGTFAPTTRTYLLEGGTIANTHYLAIPFNASSKAGAMVVANFMQSPAAQIEKAKPSVWGDLPVIDIDRLDAADRAAMKAVPRGQATLAPEMLADNALPELQGDWLEQIERGWQAQVLRQQ